MENKKKSVGAMWLKKDKSGNAFMSGQIDKEVVLQAGARFVVFKNSYKTEEKHPDYKIFLSEKVEAQSDIPF